MSGLVGKMMCNGLLIDRSNEQKATNQAGVEPARVQGLIFESLDAVGSTTSPLVAVVEAESAFEYSLWTIVDIGGAI